MVECGNCVNQQVLLELQADKKRNSEQHKEFYEMLKQMAINHAVTETNYGIILRTMAEIKADVAELKNKPSKRWESVVGALIGAVVSAVVTVLVLGGG